MVTLLIRIIIVVASHEFSCSCHTHSYVAAGASSTAQDNSLASLIVPVALLLEKNHLTAIVVEHIYTSVMIVQRQCCLHTTSRFQQQEPFCSQYGNNTSIEHNERYYAERDDASVARKRTRPIILTSATTTTGTGTIAKLVGAASNEQFPSHNKVVTTFSRRDKPPISKKVRSRCRYPYRYRYLARLD